MYHLYSSAKGDSLCPLGFHPQVRWPTRCKRCFRDYKEHAAKNIIKESNLHKEASTSSTPSLSSDYRSGRINERSWVSTTNLGRDKNSHSNEVNIPPSSWISTPDLANIRDDTQPSTSRMQPSEKKIKCLDSGQTKDESSEIKSKETEFNGTISLASEVKKPHTFQKSLISSGRRIQVKEVKTMSEEPTSNDVQFLIQVKTKPRKEITREKSTVDDTISVTDSETTDTTLVDADEYDLKHQLESLKNELEVTKMKCNRLEREKSDILLRRLAAMETTASKTTASEVLKLQQKCNEMQYQLEDHQDEKKSLMLKVRELEEELEQRKSNQHENKIKEDLQSKLLATESLCEELMDENEDIKKELRDLEIQIEELQDNFREDQALEYNSVKKELDQTTKNCRILSFKLRKSERKLNQTELEKALLEKQLKEISVGEAVVTTSKKGKALRHNPKPGNKIPLELNEGSDRIELKSFKPEKSDEATSESTSEDEISSRATLTRGGSQDDPAQLLRDLQDSLEREADLKEQLKFAEEEAQALHKKVSRIEDDNESLVLQLKKMAVREKTLKSSPTNQALLSESQENNGKNDNDSTEVKLQLELSEQESNILRKKVEELEVENRDLKAKVKQKSERPETKMKRSILNGKKNEDNSSISNDKINSVRNILTEKQKVFDKLHFERTKGNLTSKDIPLIDLDQPVSDVDSRLQQVNQKKSAARNDRSFDGNTKSDDNLGKYLEKINNMEIELAEKNEKIEELKQQKIMNAMDWNPKVEGDIDLLNEYSKNITASTSKAQMRTIIKDLEKKIEKLIIVIRTNEEITKKLEDEFNLKIKNKMKDLNTETQKEMDELKLKYCKLSQINEEMKNNLDKTKESKEEADIEKSLLQIEIKKMDEENKKLCLEKKVLNDNISELQATLKRSTYKENEFNSLYQEAMTLRASLAAKEREIQKLEATQTSITKEGYGKDQMILDLKSQITSMKKKIEEQENVSQERIKNHKLEVDQKMEMINTLRADQVKLTEDGKIFKKHIDELSTKTESLKEIVHQKEKSIRQLEDTLKKDRETTSKLNLKSRKVVKEEAITLKDRLTKSNERILELESKLIMANESHEDLKQKLKKSQIEMENIKLENQRLITQLGTDLQNEKTEPIEITTNEEKKRIDGKLALDIPMKQIHEQENDTVERQKYNELVTKYEVLEEEHVITRAKFEAEKKSLESQLQSKKGAIEQLEKQLKSVQREYEKRQESWNIEKLELEKLKNVPVGSQGSFSSDIKRLNSLLEEKKKENNRMKKEYDTLYDQMNSMRRENDELKRKLDDYEKVNRIQRNITADNSAMDQEINQLRKRLENAEKSSKVDRAELQMRYENQINVVNMELQSLQNQLFRSKREKDTYKHMLETAQKTIGNESGTGISESTNGELKEYKSRVAVLEEQISCLEDEFSEAKLECSRLKTELISERSSWEVKISQLRTKVNELQEEKVLSGGRTKIAGLRTKMELAWQKEREEQQRLLQETATLARDLRQTLFEVERERDKERLESKRKLDQLKKTSEEEQEQNKRKMTELQNDLFELGNAHAKLRTTNEKLKREKRTNDSEKELSLSNREKYSDRKETQIINGLIEQMDKLKQLAPDLFFSVENEVLHTPNPPRRTKSRSRESSPAFRMRESSLAPEEKHQQIQYIMQRLVKATEDLRQFCRLSVADSKETKISKNMGIRRAISLEHDNGSDSTYEQLYHRKEPFVKRGKLNRRSLSLEQTTRNEQSVWINNDERSSIMSLESHSDIERGRMRRDASFDSRLSSESTQSDFVDRKKKTGIIGKLRKLTKSRSFDDQDPGTFPPTKTLSPKIKPHGGSEEECIGSKKDLKGKLAGIFKIYGSTTGTSEKRQETSSVRRPLIKNGSNGNSTQSTDETKHVYSSK